MSYPQNAGKIRWMTGGSNLDKEIEHIPSYTICYMVCVCYIYIYIRQIQNPLRFKHELTPKRSEKLTLESLCP